LFLRFGVRCRSAAEDAGHAGPEGATFDAQLLQQRVDQRRLGAIAERAIDNTLGNVGAPIAVALGPRCAAPQTVDLPNLDALDLLHRAHALADDALELLEQPQAHGQLARLRRQGVFRLVHLADAFGLDRMAQLRDGNANLLRRGFAFGEDADGVGAVVGHLLLGRCGKTQRDPLPLGLLRGEDQLDGLATLGDLALAGREDALLRHDGLFARGVGLGLRLGLGLGLLGDGDGAHLLGQLDQLAALDLQLLDVALAADALLV